MPDQEVYILTGPVRSGKTTYLEKYCSGRNDVYGILTPVINGKRSFKNIQTEEVFPMESEGSEDFFDVGRYKFSVSAFDHASQIIRSGAGLEGSLLIIDEIGPLELSRRGFYQVLTDVLRLTRRIKIILVIREHMVEDVVSLFGIENYRVITTMDVI